MTMARIAAPLGTFTALALLAGCGTSHPASPAATPASSAALSEGPATVAHTWPDGLSVKVAGLERMDPKLGNRQAPGMTLVKLTLTFTNAGTAPVPLTSGRFLWQVLSGPNRLAAQDDEGDQFSGPKLTSPMPERVARGQSVTVFDSWDVPSGEPLAVRVDLGDREPFTFTGVETLLKG
jgi:hypothetical protein